MCGALFFLCGDAVVAAFWFFSVRNSVAALLRAGVWCGVARVRWSGGGPRGGDWWSCCLGVFWLVQVWVEHPVAGSLVVRGVRVVWWRCLVAAALGELSGQVFVCPSRAVQVVTCGQVSRVVQVVASRQVMWVGSRVIPSGRALVVAVCDQPGVRRRAWVSGAECWACWVWLVGWVLV